MLAGYRERSEAMRETVGYNLSESGSGESVWNACERMMVGGAREKMMRVYRARVEG